ncbi:MAG: EAL domain-containing protein [Burkholderiales bacterium]|nr:EAL domain-containing protein [Burkholderiales bacterium]
MPDYNRRATVYWWLMVALGAASLAVALAQLSRLPPAALVQIGFGSLLALLVALVPLKIPRTNQVFSIGDLFTVLLLLMHGPAAGCLAATCEALASSCRSSRRWTTRLGTTAIAAFAMTLCGHGLHAITRRFGNQGSDDAALLVFAAMAFGAGYSACTAVLMSTVARLKRNERLVLLDFASVFGWVGAASVVASALAALLFVTQRVAGLGVMLTALPMLGLLLTTLHYFARQQQAEEGARRAAALALEREATLALQLAHHQAAEQASQHLRELETSEHRFQSAFTYASIGMALVSREGLVHQANPALRQLLGCGPTDLEGRPFADFVDAGDQARLRAALDGAGTASGAAHTNEIGCRRPDGIGIWVGISCSLFAESPGNGPGVILQVQDLTARHRAELELHHRAFHDKLTGLANRERFHESLSQAIELARDDPRLSFAVLFLDFDRFKLINDSKGHSVGDEFLVAAARRLSRALRKSDLLARLGGDEFAILATCLDRDGDAVDLAERLLATLAEPLQLASMEITASASIGITFSSIGYTRPEDMLRDADIAMYRAKGDGKSRFAIFDVGLHTEVKQRLRLEGDLRLALAQRSTAVAYQPIYDLVTRALVGFEALSRWTHDELGPISPGTFVPIAEESGLITQLTDHVIGDACRHLHRWRAAHPGASELTVHVNVAARDVADPEFVPRVRAALAAAAVAPRQLVIELTENILMAQLEAAMSTLKALRQLGVGLSIDDFGTGYSSLSHLAVLPIDSLKIDMSFVRNLRAGSNEAAVIKAIVLLASLLGKQVIAEGIETEAQLELLRELGCGFGQGFYLSRPLAVEAADRLLRGAAQAAVRSPAGVGRADAAQLVH